MFLYKCDVSSLHAVNPSRTARVLAGHGARAAELISAASYGVVLQVDGQIVGLLPVSEAAGVLMVSGAFSRYPRTEHAHSDIVREMLELLVHELEAPAVGALVLSDDVRVFEQCGFVLVSSGPGESHMLHTRP